MPPSVTTNQGSKISNAAEKKEQYKFVYKNREYDCTEYAKRHPGGEEFFEKQKEERNDISEYFLCLHSEKAEKVLKSFPQTSKVDESQESKDYEEIKKKVEHLYSNQYHIDILIGLFTAVCFFVGCFSSQPIIAFLGMVSSQIVSGWLCHSWAHGRDPYLYKFVNWYSPIFAGVSTNWWNRKHNLHHMFTNVYGKDEDIQHSYTRILFGFLYLKWNVDSIIFDRKNIRVLGLILHFIFMFQQNILVVLAAQYAAGFYSANILVGNHENEKSFQGKHGLTFLKHQLITSRNYDYHGWFWTIYMGGMQYQSEHHCFPQIPFYRLPALRAILVKELPKYNLAIKVDTIF